MFSVVYIIAIILEFQTRLVRNAITMVDIVVAFIVGSSQFQSVSVSLVRDSTNIVFCVHWVDSGVSCLCWLRGLQGYLDCVRVLLDLNHIKHHYAYSG